ncbi:MAG: ATP-grasp domain-containing protein [Deltaproteobacteria bacterium]|nr:ATP-grasp domain-containing protein [Deltaproteobacteria bacterium]
MILILNKEPLDIARYHEWLPDTKKKSVFFSSVDADPTFPNGKAYIEQHFYKTRWFQDWNTNVNVELVAQEELKCRNYMSVISTSEVDVLRAARLRTMCRFATINQNPENTLVGFRDKIKMRKIAEKMHILQPRYKAVSSLNDLKEAVQEFGFPMIIKPTLLGGSIGIHVIKDHKDIENFLQKDATKTPDCWNIFIAEEFIQTPMLHLDGIVQDGNVLYSIASRYFNFCLDAFNGLYHGSVTLPHGTNLHIEAEKIIKQFMSNLGICTNFTFHAEFFDTEHGLCFCEIAARPAGGRIRDTILEATGWFDILKTHVQLQAKCFDKTEIHISSNKNDTQTGWIVYPPINGILHQLNINHPPHGVFGIQSKYTIGSRLERATHSGDELVSCLFKVKKTEDIMSQINAISTWFNESICVANNAVGKIQ